MRFVEEMYSLRYRHTAPYVRRLHDLQLYKGTRLWIDIKAIPRIDVDHTLEVVHQTGQLLLGPPEDERLNFLRNQGYHAHGKAVDIARTPQNIVLSPEAMLELQRAIRDKFHNPLFGSSF